MEQPTSPPPAQRPHNGLNGAKKQKDSQKARHRIGKTIFKNLQQVTITLIHYSRLSDPHWFNVDPDPYPSLSLSQSFLSVCSRDIPLDRTGRVPNETTEKNVGLFQYIPFTTLATRQPNKRNIHITYNCIQLVIKSAV